MGFSRDGTARMQFRNAEGTPLGEWALPYQEGYLTCDIPEGAVQIQLAYTAPVVEPPPIPESADFLARVLEWLRSDDGGCMPQAAEVTHVTGDGTDWEGDTEGGFYSTFAVEIEWLDEKGTKRCYRASGSDAEALWGHVVKSWPTPVQ